MNKIKVTTMSIAFAVTLIAMMLTSAYAYGMWNFDEKYGTYSTVQVGVAGNYNRGKLYSPAAYVKGIVDIDLPNGYSLIVIYHFEWTDINGVTHYQDGQAEIPGIAGNWVRIEPTGLPSVVYDIVAEGRNMYDNINDTALASASLPWL